MHIPVLREETLDLLDPQADDVFLDGTVGFGGHARAFYERVEGAFTFIGLDQDPTVLDQVRSSLEACGVTPYLQHANFRHLDSVLDELEIPWVSKILLDLGVSSMQLDTDERGFSFQSDAPLDMRMDTTAELTAKIVINEWEEESLRDIIWGFGEERFAKRIAGAIVEIREKQRIQTTSELAELIKEAVPTWYRKQRRHPATKTFQAIRMAVNDELGALKEGLEKGFARLAPEGRLVVISFQSLEDRIVKRFFKAQVQEGTGTLLTKKPIVPTEEEVRHNPRSRSSKLRAIQKT